MRSLTEPPLFQVKQSHLSLPFLTKEMLQSLMLNSLQWLHLPLAEEMSFQAPQEAQQMQQFRLWNDWTESSFTVKTSVRGPSELWQLHTKQKHSQESDYFPLCLPLLWPSREHCALFLATQYSETWKIAESSVGTTRMIKGLKHLTYKKVRVQDLSSFEKAQGRLQLSNDKVQRKWSQTLLGGKRVTDMAWNMKSFSQIKTFFFFSTKVVEQYNRNFLSLSPFPPLFTEKVTKHWKRLNLHLWRHPEIFWIRSRWPGLNRGLDMTTSNPKHSMIL